MMTSPVVSNNIILEEIRKSRQEVKATIEALEVKILLKIEEVNRRVTTIEKENQRIEKRIEHIERTQKKNNIIIFGLQQPQQVTPQSICEEIKKLTGVIITLSDLNNVYPLGKLKESPIKVEFLSYLKNLSILKNASKLKGSNISIANDLTFKQQLENKTLRKHLNIAKQEKPNKCYIRGHKLYVNDKSYTAEELKDIEEQGEVETQTKSISAPGTPSGAVEKEQEGKETLPLSTRHNIRTPLQLLPAPQENKIDKKGTIQQSEKQTDSQKRKTRSGSTTAIPK